MPALDKMNIRDAPSWRALGRLVAVLVAIVALAVGLHKLTGESLTDILTAFAAVLTPLAGLYSGMAWIDARRQKMLAAGNVASTPLPHSNPSNDGAPMDGE